MTMHRRTTSLKIANAVVERGQATIDELMAVFPQHSRPYIAKALSNAKNIGLVRLARRGKGAHGNTIPGIWAAPLKDGESEEETVHCVASVWQLARPPEPFALPGQPGRRYTPLGEWDAA